jgi:hypothetical protein
MVGSGLLDAEYPLMGYVSIHKWVFLNKKIPSAWLGCFYIRLGLFVCGHFRFWCGQHSQSKAINIV